MDKSTIELKLSYLLKHLLLSSLIVCNVFLGMSQMILNQNGEAFTSEPFFNNEVINKNRIHRITGEYSFKKNKDLIRAVPGSFTYEFNNNGYLSSSIDIRWNGKSLDTTVKYYSYNQKGSIISLKKSENQGITLQEFKRDSLNRIISQANYRVSLNGKGEVLNKTEMNTETMEYTNKRKTTFNSYKLPYLISYDEYNEDGYKISSIDKLKMGGTMYKKLYIYNKKGLLVNIKTFYDRHENPVEELKFQYDDFGNLIERHEIKQEVFIRDLQIIFDNKTGLLHSIIDRNPINNFMSIIRFTNYEFYL